jgi:acetate kinase
VRVLVVNAGSSSLKLALLDGQRTEAAHELPLIDADFDDQQLRTLLAGMRDIDAVGHRIVHGGASFAEPTRIDADVERQLRALVDLAPLHQPKSLAALDAVSAALPQVPAVACFDTAFHRSMPPAASTYALPASWRERFGIRRYGFHGISHAWVARRVAELVSPPATSARIVSCHLGAGASLCAIRDGRSIDTTMGFTPLEGLVMATRAGNVDPGALLWLLDRDEQGVEPAFRPAPAMAHALEHGSGLLGLAGTGDMRELLARTARGDGRASAAFDVYIHRLRGAIAQMAASLGGIDTLVFTGGVGERSAQVRASAVASLGFLGLALDEQRNRNADADCAIGSPAASARTLLIAAREDHEIARQVTELLDG